MLSSQKDTADNKTASTEKQVLPGITLPKGGGAIRGIGEKFTANPVTGTGSMSVPIATSPGRSAFGPQLSLSYDSGTGNGPFGIGWNLSLPALTRKTDKGLPKYRDAEESDVFILSGAEDLVQAFKSKPDGTWMLDEQGNPAYDEEQRDGYQPDGWGKAHRFIALRYPKKPKPRAAEETLSTIENADSITFVLASVFRSCIGT